MNRVFALTAATLIAGCASHRGHVDVTPMESSASIAPSEALIKGEMLFRRGEYILAIDAFRRAVRAAPEDMRAYNGLGVSYAAIGRHDLADRYLELALARAPGDGRVLRNLARSYASEGRVIEAKLLEGSTTAGDAGLVRPTLAQLSARLSMAPALRPTESDGSGPRLQRVSLGEVLLTTTQQSRDRFGQRGTEVVVSAVTGGAGATAVAPHDPAPSDSVARPPEPDKRKIVFSRQGLLAASANISWPQPRGDVAATCGSKQSRVTRPVSKPFCGAQDQKSAMRPVVQVVTTADQMLIYTGSFKTVRLNDGRRINLPVIIHVSLSKQANVSSEQEAADEPLVAGAGQVSARAEGVAPQTVGRSG